MAGRDFAIGVSYLLRGAGLYARRPRLMLLGLLPALISAVVLAVGLITLVFNVHAIASWLTPFADHWSSGLRQTMVIVAEVAILGVAVLVSVFVYTALTLLVGEPFYEAISVAVDDSLGGLPDAVEVSFWRSLPRGVADSVRLMAFVGACGVPLFLGGLIPLVGETVVPIVGGLVGGWALALELTGIPFERRGLRYRDRLRLLRGSRMLGLGFGAATFVCFLVPLGAVLFMPAAVAGATLLSRRLTGQSDGV
jgi:CysZ protein